jgi:hypothetical protein
VTELARLNFDPEVTSLLLARGTALPALVWHARPNQAAKTTLDAIDGAKLFGRDAISDEQMAAAVRALLYLWHGWPDDCQMHSQAAATDERTYLGGIGHRQAGNAERAKAAFRQLNGHPTYQKLASHTLEMIGPHGGPLLQRLKQIVELDEQWEPFMFVDVFEQACTGKLDLTGEEIVRRIQAEEFALLFVHCYQQAIGRTVGPRGRDEMTTDDESNLERMRELIQKRKKAGARRPAITQRGRPPSPTPAGGSQESSDEPRKAQPSVKPASGFIRVACPKCRHVLRLPESAHGGHHLCSQCGIVFAIPAKKPASTPR